MKNQEDAVKPVLLARPQPHRSNLEMPGAEPVRLAQFDLQLRGLRRIALQRPLDDLMQKMVTKHLHDGAPQRGSWKQEHVLESLVEETDPELPVQDHDAFNHARQDCSQAEVLLVSLAADFAKPDLELVEVLQRGSNHRHCVGRFVYFPLLDQAPDVTPDARQLAPEPSRKPGG
jgi:hypothetical protein